MPKQPRLYPFASQPVMDYAHRKLIDLFSCPTFPFELPQLSPAVWERICGSDSERERLEFVGDAIIGAMVAEEMYQLFPHGTPGFYTSLKSILLCNATFAHLMHKVGFASKEDPIKPAADAFEVIMAAYHHESGSAALRAWVRQSYNPLIKAAGRFCETYRDRGYSYKPYDCWERLPQSSYMRPRIDPVAPSRASGHRTEYHRDCASNLYETRTLTKAFDSLVLETGPKYPHVLTGRKEAVEPDNKADGSTLTSRTVLRAAPVAPPVAPPVIPTASLLLQKSLGSAANPIIID